MTSKQYQSLTSLKRNAQRTIMEIIPILTRNCLYDKMFITRTIAQLVEQLVYTCANVFQRSQSSNQINDLIDKSMSYSIDSREQENNSLT